MKELKLQLTVNCPSCGNIITVTTAADGTTDAVCTCQSETKPVSEADTHSVPAEGKHHISKSERRLKALIDAGIDTTGMLTLNVGGADTIVRNNNGKIEMVNDDDPIFTKIKTQGYTFQSRLHKQWVMSQLLNEAWDDNANNVSNDKLRSWIRDRRFTDTDQILKLMCDKALEIAAARRNGDTTIADDERYYNKDMYVVWLRKTYMNALQRLLERSLKIKNCKGKLYVRVPNCKRFFGVSPKKYKGTFIEDLHDQVYKPLTKIIENVESASTPFEVYKAICSFRKKAIVVQHSIYKNVCLSKSAQRSSFIDITGRAFENAFVGYGAFFTMQNMIRFHGCKINNLEMQQSEGMLSAWANDNINSAWWMWGAFKQFVTDNCFDFRSKQAAWSRK